MSSKPLILGVIEGFYGIPWSPSVRLDMVVWLAELGINAYLYAPKSDSCLRKDWRNDWSASQRAHLKALSRRCEEAGLRLFLGLSPFALYLNYDKVARRALREKVRDILDLGVDGLAILFDDMPGALDQLALRQAEICADVQDCTGDLPLLVCPTYYSDDAVLDRVFGSRPEHYLETLGRELAVDVGIFWTGPEVCSRHVDAGVLAGPSAQLRRKLNLWDNYPVNDSKLRSGHLYVQALAGRSDDLRSQLAGHWCNAMNQAALSLPALASLPALYDRLPSSVEAVLGRAGITGDMRAALQPLASHTLDELDSGQRIRLHELAEHDTPAGRELRAWLAGVYVFDPACLTD